MTATSNSVEGVREAILRALDSVEKESRELRVALTVLDGRKSRSHLPHTSRDAAGRHTRARKSTTGQRALSVLQRRPGLTASEVGVALKQKVNNVYAPLERLVATGKLTKTNRRYYPAD